MKFRSAAVTGGTGFLGRYVIKKLLEQKVQTRVLCKKNVELPECEVVVGDLHDMASLKRLVAESEVVFHLAGQVDVEEAEKDRVANFDINVRGTLNLLECAKQCNIQKFIFASTSHVYGSATRVPIPENEECKPLTVYGLHKLLAEQLCTFYGRDIFHCAIARMSNLYGNGMSIGVVKDLIARAKAERYISLRSTGAESRDFLHAEDAANALMILAAKGKGVFNVGSGHGTKIRELAAIILRETGCMEQLVVGKSKSHDLVLSIKKIRKLGYVPHMRIEDNLGAIIRKG